MKTTTYSNEKKIENDYSLTPSTSHAILKSGLNFLIAVAFCALVNLALRIDYVVLGNTLGEESVTEFMEQIMLIISASSFYYLAKTKPQLKHAAVLIGSFFLVMLIRENDGFLDHIAHGSWVYPALFVTFSALFYAFKNGKQTLDQMAVILSSNYMNMLILGVVLLLVYSRLFGMGDFWKGVMQEHYIRDVKNIAEEGTELLAYCIIAFSSFKIMRGFRKQKAH
ncbi:hypothetical protein BIY21_15255 [Vibrio ponticus]|uniref:Uncharacterized protein n=1 Tax=Vibrio ponticus TaxID=265668 RepID=A0A3N3E035_9VIBR|nr:hypothetical protein BIY21_15255 [Vibrio ponticus]ROV60115.1 hypothetical protein EGH82_10560 [Vibrio ponticus]